MASLSEHHQVLTNGAGKCSKPMWDGMGMPAGFCDEPAYGRQDPILPDVYCAGLACPRHGGPSSPVGKFWRSIMMGWFKRLFQPRPGPRALVCVSYQDGERLLLENAGWRLAPEEDRNRDTRVVYLERPAQQHGEKHDV